MAQNPFADLIPTKAGAPAAATANPFADLVPTAAPAPGAGKGRLASAGASAVQGAADTLTSIPQSVAISRSSGARDMLAALDRIDRGEEPATGDFPMGEVGKLETYRRADPASRAAMRAEFEAGLDPRENPLYKAGTTASEAVKAAIPTNPAYEGEFFADLLPGAIGSTGGFLAGGLLARVLGLPAIPTTAGLGMSVGAAGQFQDALDHGASVETALKAAGQSLPAGASEALPIAKFLDVLDKGSGGSIRRLLIETAKGGTEEALQELGQTIAQNAIAAGLYDPERGLFTGTPEAGGAAFTTGALFSFLLGMVGGRRGNQPAQQPQPEAQPEPVPVQQTAPSAPPAQPQAAPIPQAPTRAADVAAAGVQRDVEAAGAAEAGLPPVGERVRATGADGFDMGGTVEEYYTDAAGIRRARVVTDDAGPLELRLDLVTLAPEEATPQPAPAPAAERLPKAMRARLTKLGYGPEDMAGMRRADALGIIEQGLRKKVETEPAAVGEAPEAVPAVTPAAPQPAGVAVPPPAPIAAEGAGLPPTPAALPEPAAPAVEAGSRAAPVEIAAPDDVSAAAERTVDPTPAQAEAGNYRKRHVTWQGLGITVETEQGQVRSGVAPDGTTWEVEMPVPYGYIKRTEGKDGDQVDVYLGPQPDAPYVFVVNQIDPATGRLDEHKVMAGFKTRPAAMQAYKRAFSDGSGQRRIGTVATVTIEQFKDWLRSGNLRKAIEAPPADAGMADATNVVDLATRRRRAIAQEAPAPDTVKTPPAVEQPSAWSIPFGDYVSREIGPDWFVGDARNPRQEGQGKVRIKNARYAQLQREHRQGVADALARGDEVPWSVLASYQGDLVPWRKPAEAGRPKRPKEVAAPPKEPVEPAAPEASAAPEVAAEPAPARPRGRKRRKTPPTPSAIGRAAGTLDRSVPRTPEGLDKKLDKADRKRFAAQPTRPQRAAVDARRSEVLAEIDRHVAAAPSEADVEGEGGPGTVKIALTTTRGRQTTYSVPNTKEALGRLRKRLETRSAERLFFARRPVDGGRGSSDERRAPEEKADERTKRDIETLRNALENDINRARADGDRINIPRGVIVGVALPAEDSLQQIAVAFGRRIVGFRAGGVSGGDPQEGSPRGTATGSGIGRDDGEAERGLRQPGDGVRAALGFIQSLEGVTFPESAPGVVYLNVDADQPHLRLLGHEMLHHLSAEDPALYDQFQAAIAPYVRKDSRAAYATEARALGYPADVIGEEFLADIVGDGFLDARFWRAVGEVDRSLLGRVVEAVRGIVNRIVAALGEAPVAISARYLADFDTVLRIAGQIMGEYGLRAAPSDAQFALAYHGSPHDFDTFTTEKIGTGEGAHAYGWGLYFASRKGVAAHYRNVLAPMTYSRGLLGRKKFDHFKDMKSWQGKTWLPEQNFDIPSTLSRLREERDHLAKLNADAALSGGFFTDRIAKLDADIQALDKIEKSGGFEKSGRLYQVDLAPAESDYLLHDRTWAKQSPAVKEALMNLWVAGGGNPDTIAPWTASPSTIGQTIYANIATSLGSEKAASKALHDVGIPGIKYLDGASRNKPLREVKREFLAELPEDASIEEVEGLIGKDRFSPKYEAVLVALQKDDWLGFDYPSQAISAAYSRELANFDASTELKDAISASQDDGTYNYVIFDDSLVTITDKFARGPGWGEVDTTPEHMRGEGRAQIVEEIRGAWAGLGMPTENLALVEGIKAKATAGNLQALRDSGGGRASSDLTAAGVTRGQVAAVALFSGNHREATYHEAFHVLENAGAVTPEEMAVLVRENDRLKAMVSQAFPSFDTGAMPDKEVRAYAFQAYMRGIEAKGLHIAIRRVWQRLARFVRRVRAILEGRGVTTAEDVFEAVRTEKRGQFVAEKDAVKEFFGLDDASTNLVMKVADEDLARINFALTDRIRENVAGRLATPENVTVVEPEAVRDLNPLKRPFYVPSALFRGTPALYRAVQRWSTRNNQMQAALTRVTREWSQIQESLTSEEFADLSAVLFRGDTEETVYTADDLRNLTDEDGAAVRLSEPTVGAYLQARRLIEKTGRLVDQHERAMRPMLRNQVKPTLIRQIQRLAPVPAEQADRLLDARYLLRAQLRAGRGDLAAIQERLAEVNERLGYEPGGASPLNQAIDQLDIVDAQLARTSVRRRVGYIPHKFFGSWAVYRAVTEVNEETGEATTHHELIADYAAHGFHPDRAAAIRAARAYAENHADEAIVVRPTQFRFTGPGGLQIPGPRYTQLMDRLQESFGIEGAELRAAMDGVVRPTSRRRWAGFKQQRKGVEGYSKDLDRVLRSHFGEVVRYVHLDRIKYEAVLLRERLGLTPDNRQRRSLSGAFEAYVRDLLGEKQPLEASVDELFDRPWAQPLHVGMAAGLATFTAIGGLTGNPLIGLALGSFAGWRFYVARRDAAEYGGAYSRALTGEVLGITAHLKLGAFFNLFSPLVNITQIIINTASVLPYRYVMRGFRQAMKAMMGDEKLRRLLDRHNIDPVFKHSEVNPHMFDKPNRIAQLSMLAFDTVEKMNRATTFLGAYYQALDRGQTPGEAQDYALEVMNRTQFDYSAAMKPELLRNTFARVPLQFKNFVAQQLNFAFGLKGSELPKFLMHVFLVAGVLGFPGMQLIDWLLDWLFGWSPIDQVKRIALTMQAEGELAGTLASAIARGLPALIGVDISTRAGMGEKFLPQLEWQDLIGPAPSTLVRARELAANDAGFVDQLRNLSAGLGAPLKAVETLANGLPIEVALTNPADYLRALTDDRIVMANPNKRYRAEVDESTLSLADVAQMAFGGSPLSLTQTYDWKSIARRRGLEVAEGIDRYMDRIARAYMLYSQTDFDHFADEAEAIVKQAQADGVNLSRRAVRELIREMQVPAIQRQLRDTRKQLRPELYELQEGLTEQ